MLLRYRDVLDNMTPNFYRKDEIKIINSKIINALLNLYQ